MFLQFCDSVFSRKRNLILLSAARDYVQKCFTSYLRVRVFNETESHYLYPQVDQI